MINLYQVGYYVMRTTQKRETAQCQLANLNLLLYFAFYLPACILSTYGHVTARVQSRFLPHSCG